MRGAGTGRSRRGGAVTTRGGAAPPEGWSLWWRHHRDEFLWELRDPAQRRGPVTAARAPALAEPTGPGPTAVPHGPTAAQVDTRIVPLLLERLGREGDGDALAEAALALGRVTRPSLARPVTDALLPLLAHHDARVTESVALALGLLGTEDARLALEELSTCSPAGHGLCGAGSVPDRLRMSSTLALGLLGDARSAPCLQALADGRLQAGSELRAGAVLSLGLLDTVEVDDLAIWLGERSRDRRLPLDVQASLATSLGRLGHPAAVAALVSLLDDRDVDHPTRQAAAAALGRASSLDDPATVDALIQTVDRNRDAGTRQLSLLSLARLAAVEPATPAGASGRRAVDKLVRRELRRPKRSLDRPFIALAAGLLMRDRDDLRRALGPDLIASYEGATDPAQRGAFALALGLARIVDATGALRDALEDCHDDALAGHLAVALGLLGDTDAAASIGERLLARGGSVALRTDLATALRLLDDETIVPQIAGAYGQAAGGAPRDGLAAALGALRHGDGLEVLLRACADDDLDAADRARACAALGRLAETTPEPFASRILQGDAPAHALSAVDSLASR